MKINVFYILLMVVLLVPAKGFAQQQSESAKELFKQANAQYQAGEYDEAIALYQKILERNKQSAALYYNLGNAFKRKGELGRAILNYERALLIDPRDADINANRKFVLAEARVSRKLENENFIQRKLREHIAFYSFDEMIMIAVFLVFCGATLILFRDRFEGNKVIWISILVILSTLFLIFVVGYGMKVQDVNGSLIVLSETEAKYEPRDEAVVHYHIHQGEKLKLIRVLGAWYKIERKDGKLGWIRDSAAENIINE